jgi:preprotein translocase subunit SecG
MQQIILIFHVLVAIALVGLVLLQKGKGASMGAAFGSGASQTVFGSKGSGGFLMKFTFCLAALFFITSITLTYMASTQAKQSGTSGVLKNVQEYSKVVHEAQKKQTIGATLPAKKGKVKHG